MFLVKLDRFAAWVLFFVILFYGVTGYGITKGFLDPQIARSLHFAWLGLTGIIAFSIHTFWSVHMAFKRWGIWNIFTKILLAVIYLVIILGFIYLEFFYPTSSLKIRQHQVGNSSYLPKN